MNLKHLLIAGAITLAPCAAHADWWGQVFSDQHGLTANACEGSDGGTNTDRRTSAQWSAAPGISYYTLILPDSTTGVSLKTRTERGAIFDLYGATEEDCKILIQMTAKVLSK